MKLFAVAIALTALSSSVDAAPDPGYHEVTLATVAGQGEAVESKLLLVHHLKGGGPLGRGPR